MEPSAKKLKLVKLTLLGSIFFFCILGYGMNMARYFILQGVSNSVVALKAPLDEKRMAEVLGTAPLSEAQRHFFLSAYHDSPELLLSFKRVIAETLEWSQNGYLSQAADWAWVALCLALWLRMERRLGRPQH